MKLVVAEKPSVARDLARVLGATRSEEGSRSGNGWVITWCIGHLVELEEPASYDSAWKRWSLDTLPMVPDRFALRPVSRTVKQWRIVRDLLKRRDFDVVVNACDAGREGELIFRHVYDRAGSRLPIQRLWISSLTDEAIQDGFTRLRPGRDYDDLADAARARSEADWLVGMNATRAMTIAAGRDAGVSSIGRVQTPTLALIVAREEEIERFVPQDFWEVVAKCEGDFSARWTSPDGATRVGVETAAIAIADRTRADDDHLTVRHVNERSFTEAAPQLFDLTTLQRTANQRYGFSAQRTLKAAQALYERRKMISYPRTSSRHLSSDQKKTLPGLVQTFANDPDYGPHAARLKQVGLAITRRVVDDSKVTDHHAIVPISGKKSRANLDPDEAKIYDLVVRRFLAALHPPAKVKTTELVLSTRECRPPTKKRRDDILLEADVPEPPDAYVARGRVVVEAGWQAVEPPKRSDQVLPPAKVGDRFRAALDTKHGRTKPPPRHTDASLLGAMETAGKHVEDDELREAMKECGLGTPATRASILETLIKREYVKREKKSLVPTPKGRRLIQDLAVPTLRSAEMTGDWEAKLGRIARGQLSADEFRAEVVRFVGDAVAALAKVPARPAVERKVGRCPRCNADVVERRTASECVACQFSVPRRLAGRELKSDEVRDLLRRGRTGKLAGFRSKKKRRFRAALKIEDGEVRFDFGKDDDASKKRPPAPKRIALDCPRCRHTGLLAGRRAWGCARWREGCDFTVPYVVEGKKLTDNELKDLLTKGKTRKAQFGPGKGRLHLDGDRYELRID